ncbi:MAG: diguanylate cyclase [Alphaproteobacteria bacterium]|nr:diguanylate cyclase [Alphaproteobacteria bacterium]
MAAAGGGGATAMQLAFSVRETASPLGLQLSQVVDRFLQSARGKGVLISDADRATLEALMSVASETEELLSNQARRIMLLETLSLTDELSGLLNRRGFEREMRRQLALARRHEEGGVIALIDLEDFRSINNVYGTAGGDAVLGAVGRTLAGLVRETDVSARIAADQFVIALGRCEPRGAIVRVGQIERGLNNISVPFGGYRVPVGCNVGVTCYDQCDEFDGLMHRLDTAIEMRKRHRRQGPAAHMSVKEGSAA